MRKGVIYFPGLNGLRAISALAVVVSHITLALDQFGLNPYIFGALQDGSPRGISLAGHGVTIFFVLSGFLITYLLLAEKERGEISIPKFYMRRILRIWPLYYLFLFICLGLAWSKNLEINSTSVAFYLFYAANVPFIMGSALPLLSHYWSLGVEEQFYLFWPWVVKRIVNPVLFILAFFGIVVGIKLVLHFRVPGSLAESIIDITRFHCMMVGALGAVLYKNGNQVYFKLVDNKPVQLFAWLILFLALINQLGIPSVIAKELIALVALALITGQVRQVNRIINLEKPLFDLLGKISYGIYVIHPLVIYSFARLLRHWNPDQPLLKYCVLYILLMSVTILASYLSYRYFEQFFLRMKNRFVVVKSSASRLHAKG